MCRLINKIDNKYILQNLSTNFNLSKFNFQNRKKTQENILNKEYNNGYRINVDILTGENLSSF